MNGWRLLADIGGTNARFARTDPAGRILERRSYDVAEFPDFQTALGTFIDETGGTAGCRSAAIDAAGPVIGGKVQLTNIAWRISETEVSGVLGGIPTRIFNDLEAVALALPFLDHSDLVPIGTIRTPPADPQRMVALNVGTGCGAATVIRWNNQWIPCPSEAGHMTFRSDADTGPALPAGEGETDVTVEDALSGRGVVNLYRQQCAAAGVGISAATASEVFARVSSDAAARRSLDIFTERLARSARDLVLASAAWSGVYLIGGVIDGWCRHASADLFREVFEASRTMRAPLSRTYSGVITRRDTAFLGLAHASVD